MEEKKVGSGEATVDNVIIKGATTAQLDAVEVTITLADEQFDNISENENVKSWFGSDMPAGLTAVAKEDTSLTDTVTIIVSGKPTEESTDALTIIIPGGKNSSGSPITVDPNDKARYFIAKGMNSLADFKAFADAVNDGSDLTQNVKLLISPLTIPSGVDYIPIARDWEHKGKFAGDFDGGGSTIEIDLHGTTSYLALFGVNNGTIHDLTVTGKVTLDEDETSVDADYIAGVVAYNDVAGHINHVIANVVVTAYTDGEPEIAHNIGGIAGFNGVDPFNEDSPHYNEEWVAGGTIYQCRNDGAIEGGFNKIGGIVGENANVVEQCANTGEITCKKGAEVRGWPGVGGITGRNGNNNISKEQGQIIDCYNWGTIVDNTATGTEQNAYGGITGWCDIDSTVKNCYTTGKFEEASGTFRGSKNPIIGMVDQELPKMTDNNFSLSTIDASSTDVPLTGTRMDGDDMKEPPFVALLNGGSAGPYVPAVDAGGQPTYPKLAWEVPSSK